MTTQATDPISNPMLEMLLNSQRFSAKILELWFLNFSTACKYAGKWSKARSPQDCVQVAVDQVRDQFEAMTEQMEELSSTLSGASTKGDEAPEPSLGD